MKLRIASLALAAAGTLIGSALPPAPPTLAQSSLTSGYDRQGRLRCVTRVVNGVTATTTYAYDAAGNRTTVTTVSGGACASATGAPTQPPTSGGYIALTSPTVQVASGQARAMSTAELGAAPAPSLSVAGAVIRTAGSCGAVVHTASSLTYTAPAVSAATVCEVDYALAHTGGAQATGRIIFQVQPGSGGQNPPPPPPPPGDCPPHQQNCQLF